MLIEVLVDEVRKKRDELMYCQGRESVRSTASRRRAVRRATERLVEAEAALDTEWGDVEDDNATCANCGQGYDSDARDTCPNCFYGYRYEKCKGANDDAE